MAFLLGLSMIVYEVRWEHSAHLFVYGVAFLLTGLPIARGLDRLFEFLAGLFGR